MANAAPTQTRGPALKGVRRKCRPFGDEASSRRVVFAKCAPSGLLARAMADPVRNPDIIQNGRHHLGLVPTKAVFDDVGHGFGIRGKHGWNMIVNVRHIIAGATSTLESGPRVSHPAAICSLASVTIGAQARMLRRSKEGATILRRRRQTIRCPTPVPTEIETKSTWCNWRDGRARCALIPEGSPTINSDHYGARLHFAYPRSSASFG
jgi:hypothetical protein